MISSLSRTGRVFAVGSIFTTSTQLRYRQTYREDACSLAEKTAISQSAGGSFVRYSCTPQGRGISLGSFCHHLATNFLGSRCRKCPSALHTRAQSAQNLSRVTRFHTEKLPHECFKPSWREKDRLKKESSITFYVPINLVSCKTPRLHILGFQLSVLTFNKLFLFGNLRPLGGGGRIH